MDIKEYYIKQISRTNKKNYENYVVCRILNKVDDISVKFITQQPIIKEGGGKALTDLYFPQIDLHIEIDEPHHKKQVEYDIKRDADIISATEHDIKRIDVSQDLESIHQNINQILNEIKKRIQKKKEIKQFTPWDIEKEFSSKFYIEKGYIDLEDKVAFRTMVDACNCFGHNYKPKGVWRGAVSHPIEKNTSLWFPKLYENKNWDNKISDDGMTIMEQKKSGLEDFSKNNQDYIVFAHTKDSLGITLYRFKGVFRLDVGESNKHNCGIYKRIGIRVKTYPHQ